MGYHIKAFSVELVEASMEDENDTLEQKSDGDYDTLKNMAKLLELKFSLQKVIDQIQSS